MDGDGISVVVGVRQQTNGLALFTWVLACAFSSGQGAVSVVAAGLWLRLQHPGAPLRHFAQ